MSHLSSALGSISSSVSASYGASGVGSSGGASGGSGGGGGVVVEEPGSILRTLIMQTLYRSLRDKKAHVGNKLRRGAWIRVESPTPSELEELIAKHELDPWLSKMHWPVWSPRIELEDENLYVIIRLPTRSGGDALTQPLLIVLTPQLVITVSRTKLTQLDEFMNRKSTPCSQLKDQVAAQLLQLVTMQFEQQLPN